MADTRKVKLSSTGKALAFRYWKMRRGVEYTAEEMKVSVTAIRLYFTMQDQKFYDRNEFWPWEYYDGQL